MSGEGSSAAGAIERSRLISRALADAARRARFSTRSRRSLASSGFEGRSGQRLFSWFVRISFVLLAALPAIFAAVFYGFVASDQYVAEAQFTVGGGEIAAPDGVTAVTGIPAAAIVQDTQVVVNYIQSRAAVEKLDQQVGLRKLYSRADIDPISRFDPDQPIEKLVKYWRGMAGASIIMPGGIVRLKVRGFSRDDAKRISDALVDDCEELINSMNQRMFADAIEGGRHDIERASERLAAALAALQDTRNSQGVLDAAKTADAINSLLVELRRQREKMNLEYSALSKSLSLSAPQMVNLKSRIDAAQDQIAEFEAKLTATSSSADAPLSRTMTLFSNLNLEKEVAERLYTGAAASLEISRLIAEHKMMYLNAFVRPQTPEKSVYPSRVLSAFGIGLGGLVLWGVLCGLVAVARNHMA